MRLLAKILALASILRLPTDALLQVMPKRSDCLDRLGVREATNGQRCE